ncbi:MAG TPA: hypothetical protein VN200_00570 [Rhodoglobus sp.]|nr:hypothetical protein [Rhodoglobus sp.]
MLIELVPIAAVIDAVLIAVLVVFQLCLAAGAPWGRAAYGGARRVLPSRLRVSSAVAAVVWALVGFVVLRRAGFDVWAPLPDMALPIAVWVVVAVLVPGVVLNAITRSRVERAIWLPVTLVMLAATVAVALAP